MISEDTQYMHHDARGERGPYTAVHAEGPWYCMVPEGVELPPGPGGMRCALLSQTSARSAFANWPEHLETLRQVGWALERSLHEGLRPGLHGEVGWLPVVPF